MKVVTFFLWAFVIFLGLISIGYVFLSMKADTLDAMYKQGYQTLERKEK
ncbi:MAG: hypothetical protein K2X98_04455 [Alphaproteobacteria bacterium]|nr:hypothetical protein [Alphaproteobacteria bacterium]